MIYQDLKSLRTSLQVKGDMYGEIVMSGQNLKNFLLNIEDIELRVMQLENSCPTDTARDETPSQGNVVNLNRFKSTQQGDVA